MKLTLRKIKPWWLSKASFEWLLWQTEIKKYCFPCDDIHYFWQYRKNHYRCWRFHEEGRKLVKWLTQ